MPAAQIPRFAKFNPETVVQWSDGTNLTGFLLVGLVLPTGYSQGYYAATYPEVAVPTFLKVPIINGTFHVSEGILYNADIEPTATRYVCWYYDSAGHQLSSTSAYFTVSATPLTPPTATLTAPSLGSTPPTPNSGPTATTNMPIYYNGGYYLAPYAATLNLDLANGLSQECVPTGAVTLSTPIYTSGSLTPGLFLTYKHTQDATGGRTLTFGAVFTGVSLQEPSLDPSTYTQYVFQYNTSNQWQLVGVLKGLA